MYTGEDETESHKAYKEKKREIEEQLILENNFESKVTQGVLVIVFKEDGDKVKCPHKGCGKYELYF